MKSIRILRLFLMAMIAGPVAAQSLSRQMPEALRGWEEWATWDDVHRFCPTPFLDPTKHRCYWPSRLNLRVDKAGGAMGMQVRVFGTTWVQLPGGSGVWPVTVRANGVTVPVLEQGGGPAIRLEPGVYAVEGTYRWVELPQRMAVPASIGILELTVDGTVVETPAWDAEGWLWFKRDGSAEIGDKNFLSVKLHMRLEDGIPMWLRTQLELTVAGKSREEEIGSFLPDGWKLSAIESPIPVAVDDEGRMKAQVRAGRWTIRADGFRSDNPTEFRFGEGKRPAATEALVGFEARPDLRMVEILGAPSVDVSQTTFPDLWKTLPVYRWDTAEAFRLEQRMRGMGDQRPAGLSIGREWWLDEDGRGLTFRDRVTGSMQQVWRMDVAAGQDLGSVRSVGQGQLITRNPQNGAPGVEIRTRNLNLEATGRMPRTTEFSATGWRSDAESLQVTLNLPPGWRLFALLGSDWVRGDWLTAWTLLDLFLLLIFSLTVFRMWNLPAAILAFLAFGLSYHESGAPRFLWLTLMIPLALQRVVPPGWGQRWVAVAKWTAVGVLVLFLVPFIGVQVQQAIYPQLEVVRLPRGLFSSSRHSDFQTSPSYQLDTLPAAVAAGEEAGDSRVSPQLGRLYRKSGPALFSESNLSYDTQARIQTGPGVPEWSWRAVSFGWNGPVQASQTVRPVLIPLGLERVLTVLRVGLLLGLGALLLRSRSGTGRGGAGGGNGTVKAVLLLLAGLMMTQPEGLRAAGGGGIPDAVTLGKLRERLLAVPDAFPNAADIPSVELNLSGRRLVMDVEVHTAVRTAVPMPGRLPAWSPVKVEVNGEAGLGLRRDDGYLWVVLPAGVHRVRVEGMLANAAEWEWTFLLRPRQVRIEAPDWTVSGVRTDGVPEAQVFFAPRQRSVAGQASYERQEVQTVARVDRRMEMGLLWQMRTEVTRLSPLGKAVALRVPLLPGENVLSAHALVTDGFIEVRLGAQEPSFGWDSGMTPTNHLQLETRTTDAWVERWELVASPVWNVGITGLIPLFEPGNPALVPVWQPWPGESTSLEISRPEAIAGATMTVSRAVHEIRLGRRQRTSHLELSLRCSLGEDFLVELPADAEVTALIHNLNAIPVRKDGQKLIIPVRPGEQTVVIDWKVNVALGVSASAGEVRLPVDSANIQTVIHVPEDRWVLWAAGPRRGPAVRFWGILACSLLAALALGQLRGSPLRRLEWMLLAIGLTQVPLPAALVVVGWLFLLAWRGRDSFQQLGDASFNVLQVSIVGITTIALGVLMFAVGAGLLGNPEMFVIGNGSTRTVLRWYQDRSDGLLPQPACGSISIWWYRFLMLLWALWLATSLIRWLRTGWEHFVLGGWLRRGPRPASVPPVDPVPKAPVPSPGPPPLPGTEK
jgi:hypothetical protein